MKKILLILLAVLMCIPLMGAGMSEDTAEDGKVYLTDAADKLDASTVKAVNNKLKKISDKYNADVAVYIMRSKGYRDEAEIADDLFDGHGYGRGKSKSGLLLLIYPEGMFISTSGSCIKSFTYNGIEKIYDKIMPYWKDGDYAESLMTFADMCNNILASAEKGDVYDPREPLSGTALIVSVVIGAIISLIAVGSMRAKHKTVRFKANANDYVRKDSVNMTEMRDLFLYRRVTKRPRPKDTGSGGGGGTRISSSGRSHGGHGRSF